MSGREGNADSVVWMLGHTPVLLKGEKKREKEEGSFHKLLIVLKPEVLTFLPPTPKALYVDGTFGAGGHTRALLESNTKNYIIIFPY